MIETIGGHSPFLYRAMRQEHVPYNVVFLKSGRDKEFRTVEGSTLRNNEGGPLVVPFGSGNPIAWLQSLYHLATSRVVVVDNYIGLLAAVTFRPSVICLQLWHAVGGFKRTGLGDRSAQHRSAKAQRRFRKVYNQFQKLAVGAEALAKIHMDAFGLPAERMIQTGIPRTDLFYDAQLMETIVDRLRQENPLLQTKKVLLYAPTYRDGDLSGTNLHMDFDRMREELGEDYVVMLRLHPAVRNSLNYEEQFPGFVYDYSAYPNMNELLLVADCLITDYSSVICEYALLGRPMIFYLYDLETYLVERGLWDGYESIVPGSVVYTMSELVECIKAEDYDLNAVRRFSEMWNTYSKGSSSLNVVTYLSDLVRHKGQSQVSAPDHHSQSQF